MLGAPDPPWKAKVPTFDLVKLFAISMVKPRLDNRSKTIAPVWVFAGNCIVPLASMLEPTLLYNASKNTWA